MARIPLTSGFALCPEGVHIFRICDVQYDETFGKITVKLVNAQGNVHRERYSILGNDGNVNEGALNAFSYLAKCALNNFSAADVDPTELVNHYIKAEVTHSTSPSRNDPNKTVTFANLSNIAPADSFDTIPVPAAMTMGADNAPAQTSAPAPAPAPTPAPTPASPTGPSLMDLLNM